MHGTNMKIIVKTIM